ncbi:hypothetical protein SHI21_12595 [Bacteriovorax sp. PP10]|uniref:Uncharacterized protein n=1 Tax=Bacteriovorax antarcticus TaxID=3088717 RepID=A0ABU5VVH3_9BACT|nr:hypothetical protein [Bacteriovorax sp. PP10]MEA9357055.1 hypothetical protein [Bacteriovorax sp. PP10]
MKTLTAIFLLTSSLNSFSQEKIPAVDLNNPPKSAPVMSVSTVEETAAPALQVKENGCTQNFTNNKGLFIQDKKRFRSMTPLEKDLNKQTIKQGVVTGSGTEIRYIMSNCTHKIIVINMTPKRIQAALPHHAFRQASTIMSAFQSDREQLAEIYPLRKALVRNNWEQIKNENGKFILPCVDAKCTLEIIKVGGVDKEIELTYDAI